ncbi:hypothetical protein [Parasedimentitalea psychrophila]|uniref:Uncharacterized protein n=1 Tax=Parasedimentitalea psychrophila TaxID=2997337 RepID=A0A9Y2L2W9_9RHOB|nr:hypothetical protein [Parasedimentitalea psychrophila]WIY27024.1 hypothetical protein QPJ95_08950 [Parasedimentitalea psychrophila]
MTRKQNRRYIQIGFQCANLTVASFILAAFGFVEVAAQNGWGWLFFLVFAASMAGIVVFLILLGLGPRWIAFLKKQDSLSDAQFQALEIFPQIEG